MKKGIKVLAVLLSAVVLLTSVNAQMVYAIKDNQIAKTETITVGTKKNLTLSPENGDIEGRCILATFTLDYDSDLEITVQSKGLPVHWYGYDVNDGSLNFTGESIGYNNTEAVSWTGSTEKGTHKLLFQEGYQYGNSTTAHYICVGMDFDVTIKATPKSTSSTESDNTNTSSTNTTNTNTTNTNTTNTNVNTSDESEAEDEEEETIEKRTTSKKTVYS